MPSHLPRASGVVLGLLLVLPAAAAPPQVAKLTQPALQSGAVTTILVEGTDLGPNPRVVLPVPIAEQRVKDGATDKKVQIEVKLAADVPSGVYPMRIGSDKGVSLPVAVEIDPQPLTPFGPQIAQLPALVFGSLPGSGVLSTTFVGKKDQRLVIEVEARRLGSAIDPVVKLLDPRRLQLTWARGSNPLDGDARIVTTLPDDGTYTIELHDLQYKPVTPNRFRLRIGEHPFADLALPLAAQRGGKASFQLIGSVPDTTRAEVDLTAATAGSTIRLPRTANLPGIMPTVLVNDLLETIETPPAAGMLQEVGVPAAINGRLAAAKEEDRYRIKVQPGSKLRFDLLAERAGSALDGVLILRNEAGTQLVRSDDQPNTLDPGMEYTVPDGVTALVAAVSDVHGRGGPEYIYRLTVTPLTQPGFTLALLDDRPHLPRSGAAVVRVRANRTNFTAPIKLTVTGLPEGVTVAGTEIPEGTTDTLLSFTAPEGASFTQGVLQVTGESADANLPLRRTAQLPETPLTRALPWVRSELALAVAEPGPIGIAWDGDTPNLPIGGNLPAKVAVTRTAETKGNIRLTLLTSQVVPKAKDNKTDDPMRAIRLEGMPTVAVAQNAPELKILVPGDLPPLTYGIAVRAEILGPDNKTVLASAVTPVRWLMAAK